ncbi:hypothetical protein [Fischerella thermalis]|nr:hypothetical protein [Fischerella thermalis]
MQYQDILTIAIIFLPTALAAFMLMDFVAGLLHLVQQPRQAIALQPQTATSTCNAFGLEKGGRVLLQYSNWPTDKSGGFNPPSFFWDSPRITNSTQAIQEPITLDDPWALPIDELPICSTTHYPLPTLPTLLVLPPGKEQSKPPKRSKKTTAPISTGSPKRRGRPRKVAV